MLSRIKERAKHKTATARVDHHSWLLSCFYLLQEKRKIAKIAKTAFILLM